MGKLVAIARQLPTLERNASNFHLTKIQVLENVLEGILVSQPCLLQSHHL
jgi:hypothetical protein